MTKNEKLARNAIRVRKAKNKRVNEQNKPKMGKGWLTRLFAFVSCLLLVSALAVPCFADEPIYDIDGVRFDDEFVYQHFYDMYVTDLYGAGLSLINAVSLERFFDYDCFFVGMVNDGLGAVPLVPLLYNDDETEAMLGTTRVVGVDICFVYGPYDDMQSVFVSDGEIEYSIYASNLSGGRSSYIIDVYFYLNSSNIQFNYVTNDDGQIYLARSIVDGILNQDILNFAIGFPNEDDMDFLGPLSTLFFNDRYYPSLFKSEFIETYSTAYNEGYYEGFDDAYNYDYYAEALEQALQDIDDGTFGRNFLGGMFAAPFEALNDFTIVSWVDADGTTTSITLGLVLSAVIGVSLFIWFLKLFAGG